MSEAVSTAGLWPLPLRRMAEGALNASASLWFLVAFAGQSVFAYYVAAFYGGAALSGDVSRVNAVLPRGYVAGDPLGNLAIALHVLLAAVITVGGPLQLIPQLRRRLPALHRWTGRVYVPTAFAITLAGLFMVWVRGSAGDLSQHLGITVDAILIFLCGVMAWRRARARDFRGHRRWALRLFMAASAVWFFRVGLMFWLVVNGGPVGFDGQTFRGPFLSFLAVADSLVPLAVLELYLRTQERGGVAGRFAMAVGLLVVTGAMGVGSFAAAMGLWLPRL